MNTLKHMTPPHYHDHTKIPLKTTKGITTCTTRLQYRAPYHKDKGDPHGNNPMDWADIISGVEVLFKDLTWEDDDDCLFFNYIFHSCSKRMELWIKVTPTPCRSPWSRKIAFFLVQYMLIRKDCLCGKSHDIFSCSMKISRHLCLFLSVRSWMLAAPQWRPAAMLSVLCWRGRRELPGASLWQTEQMPYTNKQPGGAQAGLPIRFEMCWNVQNKLESALLCSSPEAQRVIFVGPPSASASVTCSARVSSEHVFGGKHMAAVRIQLRLSKDSSEQFASADSNQASKKYTHSPWSNAKPPFWISACSNTY